MSGVAGCGETECFGKGIQGVVRQRRGDGAGVSRMPWRALLGTGAVEQWCRASMHSNTESYHVSSGSVPPGGRLRWMLGPGVFARSWCEFATNRIFFFLFLLSALLMAEEWPGWVKIRVNDQGKIEGTVRAPNSLE